VALVSISASHPSSPPCSTLEGIGKTLSPEYNFSSVATPYAQALLAASEGGPAGAGQGAFMLQALQAQASEVTAAAAAMPGRVARIDDTLGQLETGDLKLRVRVLEGERAARRTGVMQLATLHTVAAVGLLNVGTQLALAGAEHGGAAAAVFTAAGVFAALVVAGMRRVARLDKFEREIRG
jgi:predicted unusual protein kinase regulating ubiquinone biosynthesis (AarF/ABC1/UbiB family)